MTFLAAVAVFAFTTTGPLGAITAFTLYAAAIASLVLVLALLGAASGPDLSRRLRLWSARIQPAATVLLMLAGAILVADSFSHSLDAIILSH